MPDSTSYRPPLTPGSSGFSCPSSSGSWEAKAIQILGSFSSRVPTARTAASGFPTCTSQIVEFVNPFVAHAHGTTPLSYPMLVHEPSELLDFPRLQGSLDLLSKLFGEM